jgi:hypothetical protein
MSVMKKKVSPSLLLAYTYFLNDDHTSYVSVGYSCIDFNPKIIICSNSNSIKSSKGSCYVEFNFSDWIHFNNNNLQIINKFFMNEGEYKIPKSKSVHCKLLTKQGIKYLVLNRHVFINSDNWNNLFDISTFLTSLITFCNNVWREIEFYYQAYLEKCKLHHVYQLTFNDYFAPFVSYCNYSRLFNEIPIICKTRLINEISNSHDYSSI